MSKEERIKSAVDAIFNQKVDPGERRAINIKFGREGAIMHIILFEQEFGKEYTPSEKKARKYELRAQMQPGAYSFDSETGLKYLGMFDANITNGWKMVKREGRYYIEQWHRGWRIRYRELSEKEFEELREKQFGNGSEESR